MNLAKSFRVPPTYGGDTTGSIFLYKDGVMQDIGILIGMPATALGLNNDGQVTGAASITVRDTHAYIYDEGGFTDLGTLGGHTSQGHAINDAGMATGQSYVSGDLNGHAFLYSDGVMSDLGTLGCCDSVGIDINERGDVAGRTSAAAFDSRRHPATDALLPQRRRHARSRYAGGHR